MVNGLRYYDLETYLFENVRRRFHTDGSIGAFDLFSIIRWKAERAKSKLAGRLVKRWTSLEVAARRITSDVATATHDEERLRVLIKDHGFYVPTASAILAVFWPEVFTVYDIRVCTQLGKFQQLAGRTRWPAVWEEYQAYIVAVVGASPSGLDLREKDRYLWGLSAASDLEGFIAQYDRGKLR
jgi:hypothetical protein